MNMGMGRRGHDAQAVHDDTLRTMQAALDEAATARHERAQADEIAAVAYDRCRVLENQNKQLRDALRDAEQEAAAVQEQRDALLAWCLPMLPTGMWADDPMPADARISRKGDGRLCGKWEPVPGDRADDWGHVPAVDFDAIRAELGLHDEDTAEVTA